MSTEKYSGLTRRRLLKGAAASGVALAAPNFFIGKAHAANEKLRVGIIPAYSFGIYWLVQDQGFAPGVDMEFSVFPSGPPAIEAMVGGSVDAITVGAVPPLAAMARKVADLRAISVCGDASGLYTIVGREGLSSLTDLEGKRLAVTSGSNFDFFLDTVLKAEGLADMPLTRINMEPIDAQAAMIAGAVDATVPLATSRKLIFDKMPGAVMLAEGAKMPIETRPSIMDIFMTTQQTLDAKQEALRQVVEAFHSKGVGMLREDNAEVVARMVAWQQKIGRAGVTAEEVEPLLNGYFYFDVPEIKEVFAKDQLKQSLLIQSEFLAGNGKISGVPDLDTMVSSQIIEQL
ncbi:ABC transporter substrate-binding protein [Paracoccus seriniphilus]|uniref:Sulfonate transport system substrate-binding protein n=1 Tax=Paracoccus seriniphilus TaxID=184748 RepID=A0A239PZK7_9RHOB|nr:ABC transporter substrate-binding protein [Paracoccus seriniphilus]WCR16354.1 ABC transporter substrate-binding protein [Paracoccus seriniphilus]SNT75761.1 sulfonate transport system substrate-binding protein [Paracoccus seriniphilus]